MLLWCGFGDFRHRRRRRCRRSFVCAFVLSLVVVRCWLSFVRRRAAPAV